MISINTNYGSLFAAKAAGSAQKSMNSAMEKLSSGLRINSAKDDAAGQGIATRLSAEVRSLQMASRNASDAQAMIDTADGAYQEVTNMLLRMREIAVQAATATLNSADKKALDAEVNALETEITRISDTIQFGGITLAGVSSAYVFQIGSGTSQTVSHTFEAFTASDLAADVDVTSTGAATSAIDSIDNALSTVATRRGTLGALSNRLDSTIANLDNISVNLATARGRIQDTDFAAETSNLAKSQIMQQAATAMLAQANASKGTILTLIQG